MLRTPSGRGSVGAFPITSSPSSNTEPELSAVFPDKALTLLRTLVLARRCVLGGSVTSGTEPSWTCSCVGGKLYPCSVRVFELGLAQLPVGGEAASASERSSACSNNRVRRLCGCSMVY
eukprot:TRINITY_DN95941_c0_g1_i1.p3 TRINITY_DN95941_c0_g1~~TRINITY_DN95941_c0_g1_i1.p3  ORF type:complete len:119 (-),score=0.90 TRINITY_DN95941_c0_g1_i1:56-412(-)